jgi:hypothetical protein
MYCKIGMIIAALISLTAIAMLLEEFRLWVSSWIHDKKKPRRLNWPGLNVFGKLLVTENPYEGDGYYGFLGFMATFGALILGVTWMVSLPIIVITILIFCLRERNRKRRTGNE